MITKIDSGALKLEYVKSRGQLAGPKDNELACNKMGMLNIFSPFCGGVFVVNRTNVKNFLAYWRNIMRRAQHTTEKFPLIQQITS